MIRVDYNDMERIAPDEETKAKFLKWREKAKAACEAIVASYDPENPPEIDKNLYGQAKPFLFNLFSEKCAYCEQQVRSNQHGDVEHFRPKGAVTDQDNKTVVVTLTTGKSIDHPGYPWLAYEWTNLLLSCQKCNQVLKHMRFPVDGTHAHMPQGKEQALLIHPGGDEEPDAHLEFRKNGLVAAKSNNARGVETIKVYGLNRNELLTRERAHRWQSAASIFREIAIDWPRLSDERRRELEDGDRDFRRRTITHIAFVRAARREVMRELEEAKRRIMDDNAGPGAG